MTPYRIRNSVIDLEQVREAWIIDTSTPRFLWHKPTTEFTVFIARRDQEIPDNYSFNTLKEASEELDGLLEALL